MADQKDLPFEFIDGTQCYECYAVFAENTTDAGKFSIAIKPITQFAMEASFFGFRIRAVPANGVDFNKGNGIKQAFPGFTFTKSDESRASMVGGVYVNRGAKQAGEIKPWLESHGVMRQALNAIEQALQGVPMKHKESLREWLWAYYCNKISQVTPPPLDDKPMIAPVVSLEEHKAKQAFKEQVKAEVPDAIDQGVTPDEVSEWGGQEVDDGDEEDY